MLSRRRRTVLQDWAAALPDDKNLLFECVIHRWESAYGIMSVALNEALALRAQKRNGRAREQAAYSSELLDRLATQLVGALAVLADHGRHFGTVPTVDPLSPENFRGETAQRAASWNSLLHHVLLSHRSRFFYKLRALSNTVEEIAGEFHDVAEDLAQVFSLEPERSWGVLECLHYDLNTCLRESDVVLKSFLCALPAEELSTLRQKLDAPGPDLPRPLRPRLSRAST
jgi:hypothetical protein